MYPGNHIGKKNHSKSKEKRNTCDKGSLSDGIPSKQNLKQASEKSTKYQLNAAKTNNEVEKIDIYYFDHGNSA